MPDFEVREVDVDDEAQLHAWWQACHDGATAGRPYDLYPTWELSRVAYPDRHPDWDFVLLAAHDGDRVVGGGLVNMPLLDNLNNAYLEVYVPEGERRRGVGTALLAGLESAAASRGPGSPSPWPTATPSPTGTGSRSSTWPSKSAGGTRSTSRSPPASVAIGSSSGAAPRPRSTSRRCVRR